jgi:hypothetical protein
MFPLKSHIDCSPTRSQLFIVLNILKIFTELFFAHGPEKERREREARSGITLFKKASTIIIDQLQIFIKISFGRFCWYIIYMV